MTAFPIALPPGTPHAACVDIGGTKVSVSIADPHGLHGKQVEPTVKQGDPDALVSQVIRLIGQSAQVVGLSTTEIATVAVASCGPFVSEQGWLRLAAPNICGGLDGFTTGATNNWQSVALEGPLRQHFANVRIENDGIAALEAERRWGALRRGGQAISDCAYVTWSTGIGVGLCVGGRVLRGKNGNAGHAGHTFVNSQFTPECGCGNRGDVESLAAGSAIAKRWVGEGVLDAAQLMAAAKRGEPLALERVDEICGVIGRMLYNLIATLDLERISLGGSVYWHHRDFLLPRLQAVVSGKLPALTAGCELVSAGLGDQVGDVAALALVGVGTEPD